jgi:hypothetical protein
MERPLLVLAFMVSATVAAAACSRRATPASTDAPSATPLRVFPVAAPVHLQRPRLAPKPEIEALLVELRKAHTVGGAAVGYGGDESTFHRIGAQLLPRADAPLLTWLAADDDPTIRALGLWGSALRGDLGTLARHYCDRDIVRVCPGGCICWDTTIGEIAQTFARSPAWLGNPGDEAHQRPSLLGPEADLTLEVQTTAIDACRPAMEVGVRSGAAKTSRWTWAALRAAVPSVPAWMIVKAISRHDADHATVELTRILDDASLPVDARLAAASGLTRRGGVEAEAAIGRAETFLRGQGLGLPRRFEDELSLRRRVQTIVDRLRSMRTWMETQTQADQVLEGYELHHALVLDLPTISFGNRTDEVERARGQALLWVARHLGDYRECWDQYRSTAYELEWLLGRQSEWGLHATLTPEEQAELAARVQAETARLDADVRCRSY